MGEGVQLMRGSGERMGEGLMFGGKGVATG